MVGPLREVGRSILVAEIAVLPIRHEPLLRFLEKRLKGLALHHLIAFLSKEFVEIFRLGCIDALIVDFGQRIQLFAQLLKVGSALLVLECGQLGEIDILRMESKDADTAIRIRIGPTVRDGSVVDGQHL